MHEALHSLKRTPSKKATTASQSSLSIRMRASSLSETGPIRRSDSIELSVAQRPFSVSSMGLLSDVL